MNKKRMLTKFSKKQLLVFTGVFAIVGGLLVWRIFAATASSSFEVEAASLTGNAKVCPTSTNDTSASNNKYVVLASSTCPGETTPPPPPPGSCLQRTGVTVKTPSQMGFKDNPTSGSIYAGSISSNFVLNGTGTKLTYPQIVPDVNSAQIYGFNLTGGNNVCWTGGRVVGTVKDSSIGADEWERWHDLNGFRLGGATNWTFENFYIRNFGDLVNISDNSGTPSNNVTSQDSLFQHSHDDCIQNDKWASVTVKNMFFDGCYSGISTRASGDPGYNASANVVRIEDSLMWLEPESPTYKNKSQFGHSGFFKWEKDRPDIAPSLYLKNVTLMARKTSNDQSVGTDAAKGKITHCENVTIIWAGSGDYPERASWDGIGCTGLNIITGASAQSAWLAKVNAWYAAHTQFADLKHPDSYYWTDKQPD